MQQEVLAVHVWWYALCALAVINLAAWTFSSAAFLKRRANDALFAHRFPHVLLSAGYVLGCGFRSILPRADVQRIVLYDSWLSSVLVGRSVATFAELCFAAQWALLLRELAREEALGVRLARLVFPLIVVAEVCSWYAVLSTNYLGNTLEQSIWTITVAIVAVALLPLMRRAEGALRAFVASSLVFSGAFIAFMCSVDVPMYLGRWLADEASGRSYLTLSEGLRDISTRWVVTHAWHDWHEEIAWMTCYFSFAVWFSVALVHAPSWRKRARALSSQVRQRNSELTSPAE